MSIVLFAKINHFLRLFLPEGRGRSPPTSQKFAISSAPKYSKYAPVDSSHIFLTFWFPSPTKTTFKICLRTWQLPSLLLKEISIFSNVCWQVIAKAKSQNSDFWTNYCKKILICIPLPYQTPIIAIIIKKGKKSR